MRTNLFVLLLALFALAACEPQTVGFQADDDDDDATDDDDDATDDQDGDGYPSDVDCNDLNPDVFPGADEICDGVDQDCDGTADEGTDCFDDDGDGQSEDDGDCDDGNPTVYEGAEEFCDGQDNDCDGQEDEGDACSGDDADGDGFGPAVDCDDTDPSIHPGATEHCDGEDEDCDLLVDEGTQCFDDDGDGQTEVDGDCDDTNPNTYPGAAEVCDGQDNDCDTEVDEGVDCSGDGDGDGFTVNEGDCDDTNDTINPDGVEICNGIDEDCDSTIDNDTECYDDDGDGVTEANGDCDDTNDQINPSATEVTDSIDNDCDGLVDENVAPCDVDEIEPNSSTGLADAVDVGELACGVIGQGGDEDWFSITVSDWTQLYLDIDADATGSPLDATLTLYESDGTTQVAYNDDTDGADPYISTLLPEGGTYYVKVEAFSITAGGSDHTYELWVFGFDACDTAEIEPNNSDSLADFLSPGGTSCGYVNGWSDTDWFAFTVASGDFVTFDIDAYAVGTGLEAQLTLFDTDGSNQLFKDEPSGTADPYFTWYFPVSGTYYIEVESDNIVSNASGNYLLVTTIF